MFSRRCELAVVPVLLLMLGCQALTGKTVGQNVDDAGVTAAIKMRMVAEEPATFTRVDVDVDRGVVYLTGIVASEAQKQQAERLARQVDGVRRVENQIQVEGRSP